MPALRETEKALARALRRDEGTSIKQIALRLDVSPSSVSVWTRDIRLSEEQTRRNLSRSQGPDAVRRRAETWSARCREARRAAQEEGRAAARQGNAMHQAGCMLYWAEGSKGRNTAQLVNSDPQLVRFFVEFLRNCLGVASEDIRASVNVYLGNGLSLDEVEESWLEILDLPGSSLRRAVVNQFPTSSSGKRRNKLPYGVGKVTVANSTQIVQHIYGAIQEYAGFSEPRWLD
jgi:hypothetical protein